MKNPTLYLEGILQARGAMSTNQKQKESSSSKTSNDRSRRISLPATKNAQLSNELRIPPTTREERSSSMESLEVRRTSGDLKTYPGLRRKSVCKSNEFKDEQSLELVWCFLEAQYKCCDYCYSVSNTNTSFEWASTWNPIIHVQSCMYNVSVNHCCMM